MVISRTVVGPGLIASLRSSIRMTYRDLVVDTGRLSLCDHMLQNITASSSAFCNSMESISLRLLDIFTLSM